MKAQHGHRPRGCPSPTYVSWKSLKQRCDDEEHDSYQDYGARGISYDPRWEDFRLFLQDMGERPAGTTLDRVDPDGAYTKNNCRWATSRTQAYNKRNTATASVAGVTRPIADWAELFGLPYHVLYSRIRSGWAMFEALSTPKRNYAAQET